MITFSYRLFPSHTQQEKLWQHANKLNWLYNNFLEQKIEAYKKDKTIISRYDLQKQLVLLKQSDPIIKAIHSQVLQQVPLRLDNSYKAFFRKDNRHQGFPKFRNCKNFFGIHYPQKGYAINDNIFKTKSYGAIKFKKHREIKGNIHCISIICKKDKWYINIITDFEKDKIGLGITGIDVGVTNLVATSEGIIIKNKTHAKYFDKQINKLNSRRDKNCKRHSRKYKYLSQVVKRLYDVKNRKIKDFQHKVSKNLSSKYDTIVIEDLNLKKMSEGDITGLNRELRNSKLASFINKLTYKTQKILRVNPRNTSKMCNKCGHIQDMPLNKRIFICKSCGYEEDRDVNSAKNILCLGQAMIEKSCIEDLRLQEAIF